MPNHITNILFVTGDTGDVNKFSAAVYRMEKMTEKTWNHEVGDEIPVFDFGGTVPFPKELEGTTSGSPNAIPEKEKKKHDELMRKYGAVNWYDWNIKNWGTKWNAYDAEPVEQDPNGATLKFRFNTAWSPPVAWLVETAKLYPSLKFQDDWTDEGGGSGRLILCVSEGIETEEKMSDHDWHYLYDADYKRQYDLITKGKYQKVIDAYSNLTDEFWYEELQKALLNRIKDIDLPLFMNFEWCTDELKSQYDERLKGVKLQRKIRWKEEDK